MTSRLRQLRQRVRLGRIAQGPARWDIAAAAFYTLVSFVLYLAASTHNPSSDGHYSWMYARSLAYDGDLDFTNDYELCGDPFHIGWTTPTHHTANFFYIGPAVFWTPLVWILKHFVTSGDPKWIAGCQGPIPNITLVMTSLAGGVVVLVTGALARRLFSPRLAAASALLATLGGHLIFYTGMNASYSHAYDALSVALFVFYVARARDEAHAPRPLALAGLWLGLAILQRSSNIMFFVVAIGALALVAPPRRAARSLALVGLVALVSGVIPLLAANYAIYGRLLLYAHGPHFIHLGHAHPLLLLFDQRGGLFAWAPILWLAVPGLVLLLRRRALSWLVVPLVLCAVLEIYVSSAALDWQGARRLVNLTPLAALCLAAALEPVTRRLGARRAAKNVLAATAIVTVTVMSASMSIGFRRMRLEWDRPLTSAHRFGARDTSALARTEHAIGPLTALPAAWVFALRYDLAPIAFGWAAHPQWYQRDHHSLEYTDNAFPFAAPETRELLEGFYVDPSHPESACLTSAHAFAVFSLQWPFATHARIDYDATLPETLAVSSRSFFGVRSSWEKVTVAAGKGQKLFLHIPPGGLDSGINELDFDRDGVAGNLCLRQMELADGTQYPQAPDADASFPLVLWHARQVHDDGAANPAVALTPRWMVETHDAGGLVYAYAGRRGRFDSPMFVSRGTYPRVAAVSDEAVVEVDQDDGALGCRTAHVSGDEGARLAWSDRARYATGIHPAIAASGLHVIEIDEATAAGGLLVVHTGDYDHAIEWRDGGALGAGFYPAVAARDGLVVEVHQREAGTSALVVRVGSINDHGDVVWGDAVDYARGARPSVALFGHTLVAVHQEEDDSSSFRMLVGAVDHGHVRWEANKSYDHGTHPVIAFDASGRGIEVHQGGNGPASLWSHDIE